jgi:hypothetical protein
MNPQSIEDTIGPARLPTGTLMFDHYLCGGLLAGAVSELIVPDGALAPYVNLIIKANAARQVAFAHLTGHHAPVQLPPDPNNVLTVLSGTPENLLHYLHTVVPKSDLVIIWLGGSDEDSAMFRWLDPAFDRLGVFARISHTAVLLCSTQSVYFRCAAGIRLVPDPHRPAERWLVQISHSYFYRQPRSAGPQNRPTT